ncbi:MAG: N,N-dimethylformamidase beta subunit family domain-containing protein [Actinomycetota bacterium]
MLEAFCWPLSVAPGEAAGLHVSTDRGTFDVKVARDGARPEVVWEQRQVPAGNHATPEDASSKGCDWPAAVQIPVGDDWRSGYYAVTLTSGDERTDAFLVVRPGQERAQLILVLSTNTYNAYNDWGGLSLYTGGNRVSFRRPMARGFLVKPEPAGRMMQTDPDPEAMGYRNWARPLGLSDWSGGAGWWNWERPFLHWSERNGFSVDVAISQDLEQHPEVLDGHDTFVCVGHDEYWSWKMRDALDAYTGAGGNAAIFSGNTCFWQVRYEDDHAAMTCFKYLAHQDPVAGTSDERFLTGPWADRRVGRPEAGSIGLSFTRGGYSRYGNAIPRGNAAFTVWQPDHWAFEGTGLQYGDMFGAKDAIVAYEVDGCELRMRCGVPVPTYGDGAPETLEVLATAPARLWSQQEQPSRYAHEPGELETVAEAVFGDVTPENLAKVAANHAVLATFTRPDRGGTVVNAGVTDWAYGLKGEDPDVDRITRNILERLTTPIPADDD